MVMTKKTKTMKVTPVVNQKDQMERKKKNLIKIRKRKIKIP